jgi:heme exporter protein D
MNWDSLAAFVHMGGYGFYVWSSFGAAAFVIFLEVVQLSVKKRNLPYTDISAPETRHEIKK